MQDRELEKAKQNLKKFEEIIAADRQRILQERKALQDQLGHMPRQLGHVQDREALMKGLRRGQNAATLYQQTTIIEWDDGYGNRVYLPPSINPSQVHQVSARITQQRTAFDALEPDQQAKVRATFGSARPGANAARYQDFLQSEALSRRFQELQQRPPTPR